MKETEVEIEIGKALLERIEAEAKRRRITFSEVASSSLARVFQQVSQHNRRPLVLVETIPRDGSSSKS